MTKNNITINIYWNIGDFMEFGLIVNSSKGSENKQKN